jgi:hypothetical protein
MPTIFAATPTRKRGFRCRFKITIPGVSFGGPIKKDKLFFFGAYEYDDIYDRAGHCSFGAGGKQCDLCLAKTKWRELGF